MSNPRASVRGQLPSREHTPADLLKRYDAEERAQREDAAMEAAERRYCGA